MTPGDVIRQARERLGLSQRELATMAQLSSGFVTRLEQDAANPTWRTIQAVAAALRSSPQLRLVPDEAAVAAATKLVTQARPVDRLRAQKVKVLPALSLLDMFGVPFVVTGAVAALLQGFPAPITDLGVLVPSDDDALLALQRLLISQQLVFGEKEPAQLRSSMARVWFLDCCDMRVSLVRELPASIGVELLEDLTVAVLPPQALLADEEVAGVLRIAQVRSSQA